VATNAGGQHVLRHGPMRAQTLGLEAVLSAGQVLSHLDALPKESTGYDWVGLLSGSEGTLAVVTAVRLRLHPTPAACAAALVGCAGVSALTTLVDQLRRRLPDLQAAEGFFAAGLSLVREHTGLPDPLPGGHAAYLLVETAQAHGADGADGAGDVAEVLARALDGLAGVDAAVVVAEPSARRALWRYREALSEAINAAAVPVKLDVALPLGALPGFVQGLDSLVAQAAPAARVVVFGHLAEGTLHVNVLGSGELDEVVTERVLGAVVAAGGSISAEHGVGRAKVRWLGLSRSPAELAAMSAVKSALDPTWTLGPGVLLPPRAGLAVGAGAQPRARDQPA
jgi:FAD/FMN-containing dehydrogenase